MKQRVEGCERDLVRLAKAKAPLKAAFRKEQRRVSAVHKKAGLLAAREKMRIATRELHDVTQSMKKAKPTTGPGAMAIVGYVERRLWCDKQQLFSDTGYFPSDLGQLMRRALAVLKKVVEP